MWKTIDLKNELCKVCVAEFGEDAVSSESDKDENNCLNCGSYRAGADVECKYLAKKFDREKIEIDVPEFFICNGWSRQQ